LNDRKRNSLGVRPAAAGPSLCAHHPEIRHRKPVRPSIPAIQAREPGSPSTNPRESARDKAVRSSSRSAVGDEPSSRMKTAPASPPRRPIAPANADPGRRVQIPCARPGRIISSFCWQDGGPRMGGSPPLSIATPLVQPQVVSAIRSNIVPRRWPPWLLPPTAGPSFGSTPRLTARRKKGAFAVCSHLPSEARLSVA